MIIYTITNWQTPASDHNPAFPSDRTLLAFATELRRQGETFVEIGRRLGVRPETLRSAIKRSESRKTSGSKNKPNYDSTVTPHQWQRIASAYRVTVTQLRELRRLGLTVRDARERASGARNRQRAG